MEKKPDFELPVVLSDNFKNLLNKIITNSKKSRISESLLKLENNPDKKFDISYIDRTDNDDVITFIPSTRVKRHLDEGGSLDDAWKIRGRAETRIGRLVRRLFGTTFEQESIEKFVNKYKAAVRSEKLFDNFQVVDGENIKFWYLGTRYEKAKGTLSNSCMQGHACQRYFGIYVNNPNQVKLCILKNDEGDKIKGRALVWKLSRPKDVIFMDRIYTCEDADVNLFVEYAKQQGWATKKTQSYRGDDLLMSDGILKKEIVLEVELENTDFNRYPYMDTFRYYSKDESLLSNVYENMNEYITLNDTGGYYEEYGEGEYEPTYVTDYKGNEIDENDAVWCDYDDAYCLRGDAIYINKGENGRGRYFIPNSPFLKYSDFSDSYYHKDDVVWSEYMKDWIYKRYAVKMYLDKDKKDWNWMHKLTLHDYMGKIDDDYYINDILYRDEIRTGGKIVGGDYHFIDEDFLKLPTEEEKDEFFGEVPKDLKIDD